MRAPIAPFCMFGACVFFGSSNVRLSTSRLQVLAWSLLRNPGTKCFLTLSSLIVFSLPVQCQSTGSIEGQIVDQSGAVIEGAEITASCSSIGVKRVAITDNVGRYQFPGLPVCDYHLKIRAKGFKEQIVQSSRVEVAQRLTQNFQLQVGDISERVVVASSNSLIEQTTVSVGHVIDQRMVHDPVSYTHLRAHETPEHLV